MITFAFFFQIDAIMQLKKMIFRIFGISASWWIKCDQKWQKISSRWIFG